MKKLWLFLSLLICSILVAGCNKFVQKPPQIYEENNTTININYLKTGLTNEDLNELAITHFPNSYTYYIWDTEHQSITHETWEFVYPENYHHYQNTLIPELNWMVDAEIVESYKYDVRIDDKPAICTERIVYLEDGSKIYISYYNDPETLNFDNIMVFYWEDSNRFKVYKFYY